MNDFPNPVPTPGYRLRNATLDDLDEITKLHIDGFIEEPMDDYCYPLRFEQYADHFKWLRVEYQYYLENPHKYVVHVVEAQAQAQDQGDATADARLVALAVWNVSVLADAPSLNRGLDQRKDAIPRHVEAYVDVAGKRYKPQGIFFEWAEKQLTLSVLTVLPQFRRRGIATQTVNWGIFHAIDKGWPVTVCASPMGELLYNHLGFKRIGTETIQAGNEEESFSSAVMVLLP